MVIVGQWKYLAEKDGAGIHAAVSNIALRAKSACASESEDWKVLNVLQRVSGSRQPSAVPAYCDVFFCT